MFRSYRRKQGLVVVLVSFFLVTISVAGSVLLGKLYINILAKGQVETPKQDSKVVNANKVIKVEPLPVFFVQTGVFSDKEGASQGVKQLAEQGFEAYQGKIKPYRIYAGVFGKREAAMDFKKDLEAKNISSYIYSEVINNSQLVINDEEQIKNPTETMGQIREWLRINLSLFNGYDGAKAGKFSDEQIKAAELYKKFSAAMGTKEKKIDWYQNIELYQKQVSILEKEWGEDNYRKAAVAFGGVVSEYINWSRQYTEKQ